VVRRSGRSLAPRLTARIVVVALALAGCSQASGTSSTTTTVGATEPSTTTTTTTIPSTTTTTVPASSSTGSAPTADLSEIDVDVLIPKGEGPFPAAVLVHGGGWVAGTPDLMDNLARFLTEQGLLTVNTAYTLANDIAGFPIAVDDVACAVRLAAAHPSGDGTVAVIGHSAGAHLSALVALDVDRYGADCPLEDPVIPDRLVGLAGPYDVSRLGPLMLPFFGVGPADDPEMWQAGNPMFQAGNNPGLSSLLMHGEEDALVDVSFATRFADVLIAAGSEALVEVVEGARHNDMHDPDFVGDLIITWLER